MTDRQNKRPGKYSRKVSGNGKVGGSAADSAKSAADPHGSEYEVGYGRPPLNTRFQKGQPRPPRKPKPETEQSFEDYFAEELKLPMRFVDETGKEQLYPKGKVLAKSSVNKALKSGDLRQIKEFIPRRKASDGNEISQVDLEMVVRFLANHMGSDLLGSAPLGGDDEGSCADNDRGEGA